jgi:hypothetical protein
MADLAVRAGVESASITVFSAQPVTWSSSALGCPHPDVMYNDVLVDGYRIVLEAGGRQYDYHAGIDGAFVVCDAGLAEEPLESQLQPLTPIPTEAPIELAPVYGEIPSALLTAVTADLQQRLGVERTAIAVVLIEPVTWSSSALGCPQADVMYNDVLVDGYRVVLAVASQQYTYHTDTGGNFVPCETSAPEGQPTS